jgi:predicted glycogen debranching enzyme
MIHINFQKNPDLDPLKLEWLDTNGRGGYASSTLANCHTRKYHGLLVANLESPPGRYVLLSKVEDAIRSQGKDFFLSRHQYPGVLFPPDDSFMKEYALDVCPQFLFGTDGLQIRKSIMMPHGEDSVLIKYDVERCAEEAMLCIKPFLAYRGYHQLSQENSHLKTAAVSIPMGVELAPYDGMPPLFIETNGDFHYFHDPCWYRQFEFRLEKERGFQDREDLFRPGLLEIAVKEGTSVIFFISTSMAEPKDPLEQKWRREIGLRETPAVKFSRITATIDDEEDRQNMVQLMTAGGQFLIRTPAGRPAVIAGYPWFSDWGRDTLISLPGLTFCSNRSDEGIAILTMLGEHEKDGLLPNYFSDHEAVKAYNSVDASLWYFWAVQQMLSHTGKIDIIADKIWPVMKNIIRQFMAGTALQIFTNKENGLLHAGDASTQLTWMDAMADGKPVTPRWGCPVEINALWYNAVCFARELGERFGDRDLSLTDLIDQIRHSFSDAFWLNSDGYLADCLTDGLVDAAFRPNQILAVSLPYSPLAPDQAASVVRAVKDHLLTPMGLRTLSPSDHRYQGLYGGGPSERDRAYHQGTVWPWLFGHFGEAYLKTSTDRAAAKYFLRQMLRSFLKVHLQEAGVGAISEIFDGDPPHRPNGCIAKAWSVAETIRLYSLLMR